MVDIPCLPLRQTNKNSLILGINKTFPNYCVCDADMKKHLKMSINVKKAQVKTQSEINEQSKLFKLIFRS